MKKILIEYLSNDDKEKIAYNAVETKIQRSNPCIPKNSQEFLDILKNLNSDNDSLIITIISHGHTNGITCSPFETPLTWCELCEKISGIRTKYPVVLNLIAICNSYQIAQYKEKFGSRVDKIWVSNSEVNSINKGLLAIDNNTFNDFIEQLDDSEAELYKEI